MRCITYKSFIMHAPNYLLHLARELRDKGITILRHRLSTLDEAYDLPQFGPVPIVINASGLGARALLGVKDTKQIYPIRGQTVLVHAPGVKTCYMQTSDHPDASTTKDTEIPEPTYIIPRPGPEGHVILSVAVLTFAVRTVTETPFIRFLPSEADLSRSTTGSTRLTMSSQSGSCRRTTSCVQLLLARTASLGRTVSLRQRLPNIDLRDNAR